MKLLKYFFLGIFFYCGNIFTQNNEWKIHEKDGFFIRFPQEWEVQDTGLAGTEFFIFSSLEEGDDFRENINLIKQNLKGTEIDLNAFVEISENQINAMGKGKILESERMNSNNQTYHRLIYYLNFNERELQFVQYYWVLNEEAWVLTFTSKKSEFEKFYETAKEIMNSFKIN